MLLVCKFHAYKSHCSVSSDGLEARDELNDIISITNFAKFLSFIS